MNKYIAKNIRLMNEFDKYVQNNPHVLEKIPDKSVLYFTVKGDDGFNVWSGYAASKVSGDNKNFVRVSKAKSGWRIVRTPGLVPA